MPATEIALRKIVVPLPLAMGKYELLTKDQLNDHLNDILAEYKRRLAKVPE